MFNKIVKEIHHTGIVVRNLVIAVKFFTEVLGLELISKEPRFSDFIETLTGIKADVMVAYLQGPGHLIELIEYPDSEKPYSLIPSDVGQAHIGFYTDHFDELIKVSEKYGMIHHNIATVQAGPNKGVRIIQLFGDNGYTVELLDNTSRVLA